MRRRRRATISELREAVEVLPRRTRIAMLEGIRQNEIIVGAYSDGSGICPMLAAHRAGGRTSVISFAKAWDRFAFRGERRCAVRRASERELLVLRSHLEASLIDDEAPGELAPAIAQHRELVDGALARELQAHEHARWVRVLRRRKRADVPVEHRADVPVAQRA